MSNEQYQCLAGDFWENSIFWDRKFQASSNSLWNLHKSPASSKLCKFLAIYWISCVSPASPTPQGTTPQGSHPQTCQEWRPQNTRRAWSKARRGELLPSGKPWIRLDLTSCLKVLGQALNLTNQVYGENSQTVQLTQLECMMKYGCFLK